LLLFSFGILTFLPDIITGGFTLLADPIHQPSTSSLLALVLRKTN